ncbi:CU044_5270 family protein [Streptomyces macrosporus]|uniref:CU044_5270 family protein n=1 Tax=Streptomyces macrosporus TaxID=44032 RepID=A0ABP5WLT6_9ACTN
MNATPRRSPELAEREELARLLPPPGAPDLPPGRHRLLKEHLMREIHHAAAPAAPARPRPGRRLALIAVPALVAAAVAAGVTVGGASDGGAPPAAGTTVAGGERQEAVRLLDRVATAASARKPAEVRDDQYVYVRTQGTREVGDEGTDRIRREDWHAVDGERDGLARLDVLSGPSKDGPASEEGHDIRLEADPNRTVYRELEKLPTDPDTLLEKLYADTAGQGPSRDEAVLETIEAMLPTATLLPEVNAALYRAAAEIPGATVDHDARDAAGRRGVGLVFEDARGGEVVWVFDRTELTYLGSEETAVLGVGVVDEPGRTPARPSDDRTV